MSVVKKKNCIKLNFVRNQNVKISE